MSSIFFLCSIKMASVAVYIQGSDSLGKVFGDTSRLKTAVYTLPSSVSALSTAVQRSSGAVLVVPDGYTTTSTSAQVASALEKLAAKKEPVVAYLGEGKQGVFLNASALAVLKASVVQEPVAVPTRAGDDVPGAETFAPSPTSDYASPLAARAIANVDVQSQLNTLVAQGAIKAVSSNTLFVVAAVPAPAQVSDYSSLMVSSPVSDGFQGSPSTEAAAATTGGVAYYNPSTEAAQVVQAQVQAAGVTAPAVVSGQTQAQSVTSSWWLWLIVVIILVILLIVSVVLYYRR